MRASVGYCITSVPQNEPGSLGCFLCPMRVWSPTNANAARPTAAALSSTPLPSMLTHTCLVKGIQYKPQVLHTIRETDLTGRNLVLNLLCTHLVSPVCLPVLLSGNTVRTMGNTRSE